MKTPKTRLWPKPIVSRHNPHPQGFGASIGKGNINDMGGLHLQENVLKFSAGWENYDLSDAFLFGNFRVNSSFSILDYWRTSCANPMLGASSLNRSRTA